MHACMRARARMRVCVDMYVCDGGASMCVIVFDGGVYLCDMDVHVQSSQVTEEISAQAFLSLQLLDAWTSLCLASGAR